MFDKAAITYDQDFTHSNIGKALRNNVWKYLDQVLENSPPLKILELNCGTGEDAVWFAQKGHQVFATDISAEMAKITSSKVQNKGLQNMVDVFTCDARTVDQCDFSSDFDLVFSNFGGLNCLDSTKLEKLSGNLCKLLKPNGRFIAVVMPRYCMWESFYFLTKFDLKKMFRRNTINSLQVKVGDVYVDTWYYSPAQFYHLFQIYFKKLFAKPVGIAIPPSYMEKSIGEKPNLMNPLNQLESFLGSITSLSSVSDHFLIDMVKRKEE